MLSANFILRNIALGNLLLVSEKESGFHVVGPDLSDICLQKVDSESAQALAPLPRSQSEEVIGPSVREQGGSMFPTRRGFTESMEQCNSICSSGRTFSQNHTPGGLDGYKTITRKRRIQS